MIPGSGLTTTKAPYIENAVRNGEMYIEQPYELYSQANHDAWQRLYARMQERWVRYANPRFLDGLATLCFEATRVPRFWPSTRTTPISRPCGCQSRHGGRERRGGPQQGAVLSPIP